jgi:hypothetical protein
MFGKRSTRGVSVIGCIERKKGLRKALLAPPSKMWRWNVQLLLIFCGSRTAVLRVESW